MKDGYKIESFFNCVNPSTIYVCNYPYMNVIVNYWYYGNTDSFSHNIGKWNIKYKN